MSISDSQILHQVYGGLTEMWNSTCLPEQTVKAQYPQLFLNSWCKESQPCPQGKEFLVLSCTCICELWHSSISFMQHIVTWLSFNTSTSTSSSELETKRSKAQSQGGTSIYILTSLFMLANLHLRSSHAPVFSVVKLLHFSLLFFTIVFLGVSNHGPLTSRLLIDWWRWMANLVPK